MRPALLLLGAVLAAAGSLRAQDATLVVFNAGSLARPLRAALDSFTLANPATVEQENAGSLETARKLTDLHRIPDLIGLADHEVFEQLLMPQYVSSYVEFARNRMVLAYTARSRYAADMGPATWTQVLLRPGVETGRADPALDPNGYRTLLVLQLAERYYGQPGLAAKLLEAMPERNIRPYEAALVGLLQAGTFDYIWSYESIAQGAGLEYVQLPPQVDLGDPSLAKEYATVSVRVPGRTPHDSVTFRGAPIVYGIAVPDAAPHKALAERFLAWLVSPDGVRVLRRAQLDALDHPVTVRAPAAQ
jgi:molybdate/tungstate transport system substrate-binding protein